MVYSTYGKRRYYGRRKYRKTTRRAPPKQFGRPNNTYVPIPRLTLAGRRQYVTLRYVTQSVETGNSGDFTQLSSAVGALANYVFIWNAPNLPDYTTVAHGKQPLGFDQYMELYNHGVVVRARSRTTFMLNPTEGEEMIVYTRTHTSTGGPTGANVMTEPRRTWKLLTPEYPQCTIYNKFDTKQFFQLHNIMDDDKLKFTSAASVAGRPEDLAYLHIGGYQPRDLTAIAQFSSVIEFDILFDNIRIPTAS